MLVPRPDRLFIPSLETLPYTHENPSVEIFRYALAVDEKRRLFRVSNWYEPQTYRPYLAAHSNSKPQDVKQVWFAGVHSDIGGGNPEEESGLAKIPLQWMVNEARISGLKINTAMFNHLVLSHDRKGSKHTYVPPDPAAEMHKSLKGPWWLLEILPKKSSLAETRKWSFLGFYLPLGERRRISNGSQVHESVQIRSEMRPDYQPDNLP